MMNRYAVNKYLLIFTFTVAILAILILIFIFLKDKICPRRSLYSRASLIEVHHDQSNQVVHDTPVKASIRFGLFIQLSAKFIDSFTFRLSIMFIYFSF